MNGICLKHDRATFNHGKIVNIYIVYQPSSNTNDFNFALEDYLFGAVKLNKNADIDKYKYSGYGTGFDARENVLYPNGTFGQYEFICTC